ncbi:YfcL family protein [Rheinheimera texasensis]|uniref:YfcL family protein n=1 Tax=Rheinheimera texasensis TaxID=306205 RepID=UPI00068CEA35|nr:YfcL family protein [Rheinheimera texasensis]
MQQAQDFIRHCADFFDTAVATASDDELFAQGYLRGHLDLAAGRFLVEEQPFTEQQLIEAVDQSLVQAIEGGELNDTDAALVRQIWSALALAGKTSLAV